MPKKRELVPENYQFGLPGNDLLAIKQKLNENRSFQKNFRTMLNATENQEFMKILQQEVDIINTDNTVTDQQGEIDFAALSSRRLSKKQLDELKSRGSEAQFAERSRQEKGGRPEVSMNTKESHKLLQRVASMEMNIRGFEKRVLDVEGKVAALGDPKELKRRIETIERLLGDLRRDHHPKVSRPDKSLGFRPKEQRAEQPAPERRKNDALNDVINHLKSKLEYRNSIIKSLAKPKSDG